MLKSDTIGELAKALALAQGEIVGAKKDSENPFFKSRYADLASVRDACQGPLSKNGLAVIQTPKTILMENVTVISVETLLAHSSGEWISEELSAVPVKDDPQGIGSCITYLRRYALAAAVGVAPEDDDGNAASQGNGQVKIPNRNAPKSNLPQGSNAAEVTQLKKALVDVCKMLNAAGDKPVWGTKRLDEFSMQQYGVKADDLELEPLRELLRKLSNKLDELKANKKPDDENRTEIEKKALIARIEAKNPTKAIAQGLSDIGRPGVGLGLLTLDELVQLEDTVVPF